MNMQTESHLSCRLITEKEQATGAQLALVRAKRREGRHLGREATVEAAQATYDQAVACIAKSEAIISQKLVRDAFDGELGVRDVDVGQCLTAGTMIITLT